jgi:hypothetical protein
VQPERLQLGQRRPLGRRDVGLPDVGLRVEHVVVGRARCSCRRRRPSPRARRDHLAQRRQPGQLVLVVLRVRLAPVRHVHRVHADPPQVAATARASGCGKPGAPARARQPPRTSPPREQDPTPPPFHAPFRPFCGPPPGSRGSAQLVTTWLRPAPPSGSFVLLQCRPRPAVCLLVQPRQERRGSRCFKRSLTFSRWRLRTGTTVTRDHAASSTVFRHTLGRSGPGSDHDLLRAGQDRPGSGAPRGRAVRLQRGHRQPLQLRRAGSDNLFR